MNKLDLHSPSLTYPTEAQLAASTLQPTSVNTSLEPIHRLMVLIPTDSDYTSTTRRISDLANTYGAHVLFLGLCKDAAHELSLRRELVTLTALLQGARVSAEARVETGLNWVDLVKSNYQAGDMIVCVAEQRTGLWQRPLSQILESDVGAPVYILSGLYPERHSRSNWLSQLMAWTGSVGIIVISFLLQIRITSLPQDWVQTTLLIFSVIGEIYLIWVWNNLFS